MDNKELDKTRAEFEAEAARRNINVERFKMHPDRYKYEYATQMWDFWQAAERAALARAGSAAPTGQQDYVLMPKRLTAANGAKAAFLGEFKESIQVQCPECHEEAEDYECSTCENFGSVSQDVVVGWDTIKDIYSRAVDLLAAPTAAGGPSLGADEMMRLRRLMRALGMPEKSWSDSQACECLCTILGEASRYIERAAPLPTKEGAGEVDAKDAALLRAVVEKGIQLHFEGRGEDDAVWVNDLMKWSDGDRLGAARALIEQEVKNLAAIDAAIAAQPKDTTDTRRDA